MSAVQQAPDLPATGEEADPLVGRVLNDRYRILEPIGQGGMGRVYKALQASIDRTVALKVLGAGHDREPNFYKRFFLEASVTAKLTHPNTITLYDYGRTDDGVFFIAMEYLAGRTLSQVMQAEGPLAQERVIHIAQQICRSLREAHAMGIIHRDLKPANVMLLVQHDDHDFVKVLDFGLVKFFEGENAGGDITNAGTFMGSPHYIAPEQARNQSPDQRCDIYSLGILLYHMLTGRVPFTAAAPVDIILKHLHEAPLPPAEMRPDVQIAPELQHIVLRCMAKSREERFQSMDELLVQLKTARARLTGVSAPISVPPLHETQPMKAGSGGQTPPTPQPALRTPSEALNAVRSTPASVARPPPPPADAMVDEYPVREPGAPIATPQATQMNTAAGSLLRAALPAALIILAGVVAAAIILRTQPAARPAPAVPAARPAPAVPAGIPPAPAVVPPAQVVAAPPPAPPIAAAAERPLPAAEQHLPPPAAAPDPAIAGTTLVRITTVPPGAEVRDSRNRLLGTTPVELRFPSGKPLDLALRGHGYRPVWLNREVDGERMWLNVTMKVARGGPYDSKPIHGPAGYKEDPY